MAFSPRATQSIEDFAASLELPVRPAADGSYSFVFERSGTLTFTSSRSGDRLVASLSKRPVRLNEEVERRIFDLAGPDLTTQRPLSVGIGRDGDVIVAVSVDEADLSLPILETCFQQLRTAHSNVD